jgi:hypothetical protein
MKIEAARDLAFLILNEVKNPAEPVFLTFPCLALPCLALRASLSAHVI